MDFESLEGVTAIRVWQGNLHSSKPASDFKLLLSNASPGIGSS